MPAMSWADQGTYLSNNKLSQEWRESAQPLMRFRQFCDIKEAFGKSSGQSVNWLRMSNVATMGRAVLETQTMPETYQTSSWGTLTVGEYGLAIPHTFKIEALSEFDVKAIINSGLRNDMTKVLDGLVEREFNSCALRYVGSSTSTYALTTTGTQSAVNTSVLNTYHIMNMRLELEKRFVQPYSSQDYVCVASLEAMRSLEGVIETAQQYNEIGYAKTLSGEVGKLHGVRFVKDQFASRYIYNSTSGTAPLFSWAQNQSGPAYMFGKETVMEAITVPEEIRVKIPTDYGRSKGIAWYALLGYKIMWETEADARIIKWESAS
jgi:hypothetical protein